MTDVQQIVIKGTTLFASGYHDRLSCLIRLFAHGAIAGRGGEVKPLATVVIGGLLTAITHPLSITQSFIFGSKNLIK
jgi:hypothetical protein